MLCVRRRAGWGCCLTGGVDPWSCKSLFVSCRIFLIVFCAFAAALVEEDRRLLPPPIDPACLAVTGCVSLAGRVCARACRDEETGAFWLLHSILSCPTAELLASLISMF